MTNDFKQGVYRSTKITMTGKNVVKVSFASEGSYRDSV